MAWTISIDDGVKTKDKYVWFDVLCTSDGSALSATNLLDTDYIARAYIRKIQGSTLYYLYVKPGTTTVAPDNTFDITLTDDLDAEIWSDTGISNTAGSYHKLYEDVGLQMPVLDELNLAISDIGTAGDQVTLRFVLWSEK
jgi:hypothetical protein